MHNFKLQMAEIRLENQELTQKVRELQIRNEELKFEAQLEMTGEMDKKIAELIEKTSKYKNDYFQAMKESQDLSAQLKACQSAMNNLKAGNDGL